MIWQSAYPGLKFNHIQVSNLTNSTNSSYPKGFPGKKKWLPTLKATKTTQIKYGSHPQWAHDLDSKTCLKYVES